MSSSAATGRDGTPTPPGAIDPTAHAAATPAETHRGARHRPFLAALLVLDLLYYAYRYPLQYNDALTSATYRDTPFVLRFADDALFVLLLGVVVLLKAADRALLLNRRHVFAAAAIVVCFSHVVLGGGLDAVLKVKGVLLYSALLAVLSAADVAYLLDFLCRNLVRLFALLLVVDAVQVALFLAIGRLPALAWSTDRSALLTQDVRFGSLWDDPNSFGLFLALFVTWVLFREMAPWRKAALVVPALAAATFTWSRTAFVLLGVAAGLTLVATAWTAIGRRRYAAATLRSLLFAVSVVLAGAALPRALEWVMRQESARIHLDAVLMRRVHVAALNVPSRQVHHSESVFAFLADNAGWIPAVLLFLVLTLPLAAATASGRVPQDQRFVLAWGALFCLSFFAIPFLWLAPMGLVFFLVHGRLLTLAGGPRSAGTAA